MLSVAGVEPVVCPGKPPESVNYFTGSRDIVRVRRSILGVAAVVTLICLFGSLFAAGTALGTTVSAGDSTGNSGGSDHYTTIGVTTTDAAVQQAENTTNNETDRHRNPEEYREDGDSDRVSSWLTTRLAERLGDSVLELSEGQYEFARQFVGDEFEDRIGQLVEVDGETADDDDDDTDDESDTDTTEVINQTKAEQERLIDNVEQYEETETAYENALATNDTDRARALARELVAIADRVESQTTSVVQFFEQLQTISGQDLTAAIERIIDIRERILGDVTTVRESVFVATNLTVAPSQADISFVDPLTVIGQLRTADGNPVANQPIELRVGQTTVQTETNATGAFEFTYRPTRLPINTSSLAVVYQPLPESIYSGSTANIPINVIQQTPTIANVTAPANLTYAETGVVGGTVSVDGIPVDNVTVTLSLAGTQLGTAPVRNGQFETRITLPAQVPAGTQQLRVTLPDRQRAVAGTTATQPVTIEETLTILPTRATAVNSTTVTVAGDLFAIGVPNDATGVVGVADQPVQLSIDSVTIETVTTTAEGAFATQLNLSQLGAIGETVAIESRYNQSSTNLGSDLTTTTVTLPAPPTDEPNETGGDPDNEPGTIATVTETVDQAVSDVTETVDQVVSSVTEATNEVTSDNRLITGLLVGVILVTTGATGLWWLTRRYGWTVPAVARISRLLDNLTRDRDGAETAPPEQNETADERPIETDVPAGPVETVLAYATDQLQTGDTDQAAEAAYVAMRESLAETVGSATKLTHREFYQAYRTAANDGETTDTITAERLRMVTEAYEQAKFSRESPSTDNAQRAVEQATRALEADLPDPDASPGADD